VVLPNGVFFYAAMGAMHSLIEYIFKRFPHGRQVKGQEFAYFNDMSRPLFGFFGDFVSFCFPSG
jgi:hypothetical protein